MPAEDKHYSRYPLSSTRHPLMRLYSHKTGNICKRQGGKKPIEELVLNTLRAPQSSSWTHRKRCLKTDTLKKREVPRFKILRWTLHLRERPCTVHRLGRASYILGPKKILIWIKCMAKGRCLEIRLEENAPNWVFELPESRNHPWRKTILSPSLLEALQRISPLVAP